MKCLFSLLDNTFGWVGVYFNKIVYRDQYQILYIEKSITQQQEYILSCDDWDAYCAIREIIG